MLIDENGDRKPDYSIQIVQNGTFVTLLDYIAFNNKVTKIYKPDQPGDWSGIYWANYGSTVPKGEPECGWDNEHCSSKYNMHCWFCSYHILIFHPSANSNAFQSKTKPPACQ